MNFAELEARLRNHVQRLAAGPRTPDSRQHREAADYIRDSFRESGFRVEGHAFDEAGLRGLNLLTGSSPNRRDLPLIIIGAHYDSVPGSPGADDNASAVAALLELARWIGPRLSSGEISQVGLLLAAYDLEEYGLLGSFFHSRSVQKKPAYPLAA
jgi:hypothetical protein